MLHFHGYRFYVVMLFLSFSAAIILHNCNIVSETSCQQNVLSAKSPVTTASLYCTCAGISSQCRSLCSSCDSPHLFSLVLAIRRVAAFSTSCSLSVTIFYQSFNSLLYKDEHFKDETVLLHLINIFCKPSLLMLLKGCQCLIVTCMN